MSASRSIGMMDPAYFIGRRELLEWLNNLLDVNLTKIEQTASGAYSCQIVDACFPGKIRLKKIRWDAKQDYEFVDNYKELQQAFDKLRINKHIEVNKLIRAKYQDNLEFMQWMKSFHGQNASGTIAEYSATAHDRRSRGKGGSRVPRSIGGGGDGGESAGAAGGRTTAKTRASPAGRKAAARKKTTPRKALSETGNKKQSTTTTKAAGAAASSAQTKKLVADVAHWKSTAEALETERNFYFGKMREIEKMLQHHSDEEQAPLTGVNTTELFEGLYAILYAAEDDAATTEVLAQEEMGVVADEAATEMVAEPPLIPTAAGIET